jgi:hypothetical protein
VHTRGTLLAAVLACGVTLLAPAAVAAPPGTGAVPHVDPNSIPDGQFQLIGIKLHTENRLLTPGAGLPATPIVSTSTLLSIAHSANATTLHLPDVVAGPGSVELAGAGGAAPTMASSVFGCYAHGDDPFYVGSSLMGDVHFTSCVWVAETVAQVCLQDSATYGLHVCNYNGHDGNADWYAVSGEYPCQSRNRAWRVNAPWIEYVSIDNDVSYWAGSGNWSYGYWC